MHRLLPAALAAALLTGCASSGQAPAALSSPSAASPSPSPTADASTVTLERVPPQISAPVTVDDDQLAGGPYDSADGQAAYLAALRGLRVLRQSPSLLEQRDRTREDFAPVLAVSTPEHRAWLEERITASLEAQDDPTDTTAKERGDELRGAMTIASPSTDLAAGDRGATSSPVPGRVRFASYDPEDGAFSTLSVSRTAVYDFEDAQGRTALAVAFDVYAPYNVLDDAGAKKIALVRVTDLRTVMAQDRGEWLWDGWDLVDTTADVVERPTQG